MAADRNRDGQRRRSGRSDRGRTRSRSCVLRRSQPWPPTLTGRYQDWARHQGPITRRSPARGPRAPRPAAAGFSAETTGRFPDARDEAPGCKIPSCGVSLHAGAGSTSQDLQDPSRYKSRQKPSRGRDRSARPRDCTGARRAGRAPAISARGRAAMATTARAG